MTAGSRTVSGGEDGIISCGVSTRLGAGAEAGAGVTSVPNIGTSGLRGWSGGMVGVTTVGAAETRGVGAAVGASCGGGAGYSSSVGILCR